MNDMTNGFGAGFGSGFPAGYSPWSMISQALAPQMPGTPAQMPQMTPAQMPSYGPTHSALSQAFAQALQNQMNYPGLLSQPTASDMGLLSTSITPAQAVNMPTNGTAPLGPNEYFRLSQAFWNAMPDTLGAKAKGGRGGKSFGGDVRGRNDMAYGDRVNGSGGYSDSLGSRSPYGNAGGGLSDSGQRDLSNYGGIF